MWKRRRPKCGRKNLPWIDTSFLFGSNLTARMISLISMQIYHLNCSRAHRIWRQNWISIICCWQFATNCSHSITESLCVGSSQHLSLYKHSVRMLSTGASEKADKITDSVGIHTFNASTDKNIRSPDRNVRLFFFCETFFTRKPLFIIPPFVLNELT